jgi:signal transduction histidine kinase
MGYGRRQVTIVAVVRAVDDSQLEQLVHEQAALRRVATLVARGGPPERLFAVVAEQVAHVLRVPLVSIVRYEPDGTATERASFSPEGAMFVVGTRWSLEGTSVIARIRDSRRPARIDDYTGLTGQIAEALRRVGIRSRVGVPIIVAGSLWGAMVVSSTEPDGLPPDTEARLSDFTELVATAIANCEASEEVERLAREQTALRRVATLVAQDAPSSELFGAVAREVGILLGADFSWLIRFDDGATATTVAAWAAAGEHPPAPARWAIEAGDPAWVIAETGRPNRVDDWSAIPGPIAAVIRDELGVLSSVGCPVVVNGQLWGGVAVHWRRRDALPPDTEARIAQFSDLLATAIANSEARAEVERLAAEQAALRRVATLVAEGAAPTAVFDAVAAEMERLLKADGVILARYESGDELTLLARRGLSTSMVPRGARVTHEGEYVTTMVRRLGQPARMENDAATHGAVAAPWGLRASVGTPIVVEGRLWGVISASWNTEETPPADTEQRMAQFAQLLDTAIANADSRDQLTASRARLVTASYDARRRVVRDLHDGAQQRLVHTVVTLKLARRALATGTERAESLLGDALAYAEQANDELHDLAHGILPSVLTVGGLSAGIRDLVERLDLAVELDVASDRFSADIEATAYFIAAEALTNVLKHSHAEHARISMSAENGALCLEVRDDGIGGADPGGHGLLGLSDRATALGGRVTVESPPGGGTRLAATLPLDSPRVRGVDPSK